jgi:tetratricopeptide (TPR) repeat protein
VDIATDLRELGRFDEAEAALLEILKQAPQHFGALVGLAHIARRRGDRAASLRYFEAAAAVDPKHLQTRVDIATDLRELGRFDEAEAALLKILKQAPEDFGALVALGHLSRRRGDRASALSYFETAAKVKPHHLPVKLEIAAELKDRGVYDKALCIIDAAIQLEPENVHARMQRAYIHRHAGDRQSARAEFGRISDDHPEFLQAFVELAVEERMLGQPGLAEQILNQVLDTEPGHLSALTQLAETVRLTGDLGRCLSIYKHSIGLHPNNMGLYIQTSQILNECGQYTAALELLDRATSLFGQRWEIVRKRTELLKLAGYMREAQELVESTFRENPRNFALWSSCVQFHLLLGELDAAAAKLQAFSSEVAAERVRIHIFCGQLAEAQYKFEEARDHYQAALDLNPHDASAHSEMFRICMLLLNIEGAHTHLEAWNRLNTPALIARGQSTNSSQSHMGQVYGEFALDKALTDRLVNIRVLPPRDRIAPLASLLRQNADHTASAIQLIVALRQAELLNYPQDGRKGFAPIPKMIVQYWDAPYPPEDVSRLMESWRSGNQDYSYRRFDDAAARDFLSQHYELPVLRAYRRAENPAEKADLFRLAYLYAHGGVYVDADDRCLAPINSVLPSHVALAVYQEDYALGGLAVGTLGNNFLAAAPNNAVIGRALELVTEALNRGDTDMVWLKTGPALITRAFAEVASKTPLALSTWLKSIAVLKRSQLAQFSAIHCFTGYKRTAQHWTNTLSPTRAMPTRPINEDK